MSGPLIATRKTHRASAPSAPSSLLPSINLSSEAVNDLVLICKLCHTFKTESRGALIKHEWEHAKGVLKGNPCVYCGKSFGQKTALKTHINTHTGSRPYPCRKGCPNEFSDPSSRTRHEKEIHNPGFGFKCTRPGCLESTKRKLAFTRHMENAHDWPRGSPLPESVYVAARNRCAEDYEESLANGGSQVENAAESEAKPLSNGKRLRSPSSDNLNPVPTKKRAFDLSPPRRNAVGSIEPLNAHPFAFPHASHERSDSDDRSTSTASSYADAFSSAYHPASHVFTNGSPSSRLMNSVQDYQNALGRVVNPPMQPTSAPSMLPGLDGYGVAPDSVPRAPVAIPHSLLYGPHSNGPSWAGHQNSYNWGPTSAVAQTPHGMSPAHIAYGNPPTRGMLNSSHSGLSHGVGGSGIHLSSGEHQAEHLTGSPSLDPRLGQSVGSFGDHQVLTRTSSEHSNSPHPDSHTSMNMYELGHQPYLGYPQQQVPRSVPGGSDQDRSYS